MSTTHPVEFQSVRGWGASGACPQLVPRFDLHAQVTTRVGHSKFMTDIEQNM